MIIGITGSVGSGKTTIAKIFEKHGYTRIDADEIGHELILKPGIAKMVINEFGSDILGKDKKIDRKKLGGIVFDDPRKLRRLNALLHDLILAEAQKRIEKIKKASKDGTKIVLDAPLLLELGADKLVDKVLVVKTNLNEVIRRNKRFSKQKIENILKRQMPLSDKVKHADFMVYNGASIEELRHNIKNIVSQLGQ